MTHILMISRCPPVPLHLGDRLIVYHLARELQKLGVHVDLLAFAETPADWSLTQQQQYTHLFHDVTLFDAQPRPAPELLRRILIPAARFPSQAGHAFAPALWREVERRLSTTDYDAVHLFGGIQVYDFAGSLDGLKTVITPYESFSLYLRRALAAGEADLRGQLALRGQLWAARRYESWMYAPYDAVTVLSDPDRDELLALNPAYNVAVIPNGIEIERFPAPDPTAKRDAAHLLFVGNYDYAPNHDAALWLANEILPRVRQHVPDARLSLVGNAPPPDLQALASDHITVTGRVPDVRPYLQAGTVFVCPLRYGAGIKNKVLEALASGIPVVATPVSVDGIAVTDGESALVADDADGLAAATVRVLGDVALQQALRERGRSAVENGYTWQRVAERYAALYRAP
jgi:glycosyltransferase involved in cell wall biosynthesis